MIRLLKKKVSKENQLEQFQKEVDKTYKAIERLFFLYKNHVTKDSYINTKEPVSQTNSFTTALYADGSKINKWFHKTIEVKDTKVKKQWNLTQVNISCCNDGYDKKHYFKRETYIGNDNIMSAINSEVKFVFEHEGKTFEDGISTLWGEIKKNEFGDYKKAREALSHATKKVISEFISSLENKISEKRLNTIKAGMKEYLELERTIDL
ncbi:MAG: hypothetical protein FWE47_02310 [Oscillospiraceae bacterium]|nr:hypothetical protein [Oscillospiraceae bacterium]